MRASLLVLAGFAFVASSAAATACTQSNTQLAPFYDGGPNTPVDSSVSDATEESPEEASVEAAPGDAAKEAGTDAAEHPEAGGEAGPSDAGDGGG